MPPKTTPRVGPDKRRAASWIAVAVLALLAAIFFAQTWPRATRANGNDLTTYLTAARAFWQGGNPYLVDASFPFIYPLFLCIAIWPLTLVSYGAAVVAWYLLAILAIAWTSAIVPAIERVAPDRRGWFVATAIVALALADVLQNNLVNGQVNPIVLALCVLFAWLRSRGHRVAAGAALGAAIALKITPAILLLYLLRRNDWRSMAWTVAATAVFAVGLPYLVAGASVWGEYHYYAHTFLSDRLVDSAEIVTHHRAFGLVEIVRQLTGSAWAADAWIAAGVVSGALWMADRPDRPHALALYLAASLLISPMSEVHHLIFLWPALLRLSWEALDGRLTSASQVGLVVVLAAAITIRFVPFAAFAAVAGTCLLLGGQTWVRPGSDRGRSWV